MITLLGLMPISMEHGEKQMPSGVIIPRQQVGRKNYGMAAVALTAAPAACDNGCYA
jgi:hypothetical protein